LLTAGVFMETLLTAFLLFIVAAIAIYELNLYMWKRKIKARNDLVVKACKEKRKMEVEHDESYQKSKSAIERACQRPERRSSNGGGSASRYSGSHNNLHDPVVAIAISESLHSYESYSSGSSCSGSSSSSSYSSSSSCD